MITKEITHYIFGFQNAGEWFYIVRCDPPYKGKYMIHSTTRDPGKALKFEDFEMVCQVLPILWGPGTPFRWSIIACPTMEIIDEKLLPNRD